MLKKVKGIMNLREEMNAVNEAMQKNKELVSELSSQFTKEINELKELKEYQIDALHAFKRKLQEIDKTKKELHEEVEQFKMLNKKAHAEMMRKFEKETRDYFSSYHSKLELDKDKYQDVKKRVEEAASHISSLNEEVKKLKEISRNIKDADFQLMEYAEKLREGDKEKVRLMKKVDELQRKMAKMIRNKKR